MRSTSPPSSICSEESAIAVLLHASRIGLLDMSWNVLCPGCGGVLDATATLKSVQQEEYHCALCAAGYEPSLDEMVEVVFTVSPRVRRIGAHDPHSLPMWEYYRQIHWSTGIDLPEEGFEDLIEKITIDSVELPAGERAVLSLQLPSEFIIVFEPVTHSALFLDVKGEPTRERRHISMVFNKAHSPIGTQVMQPGPLRLSLDNRSDTRVLPSVWIAADRLHDLLGSRKPFLTARRLLSNQTFRDLYHTDTLDIDQRLKITSLTFLFTDLRSSTELYERVGDLVAFELVRSHFRVLLDIVAEESGAVIKTIGDAVMATFLSPDQAVNAALRMREGMRMFNAAHGSSDLSLKIGHPRGAMPCRAAQRTSGLLRPDGQCRISCAGCGELHRDPRHRRDRAQYGGCRVARTQRESSRYRARQCCAASPRRSRSTKFPEPLPARAHRAPRPE